MTDKKFASLLELTFVEKAYIPLNKFASFIIKKVAGNHIKTINGCFIPQNKRAIDYCQNLVPGEISEFEEVTARDLKFHRCYFSILNFIWGYLPDKMKFAVTQEYFYKWLKHLHSSYKVIYSFRDKNRMVKNAKILIDHNEELKLSQEQIERISILLGNSDLIEYESISFGNMSQKQFEIYVKEQLPFIYENVLGELFKDEQLSNIISTIESEYKRFLSKL